MSDNFDFSKCYYHLFSAITQQLAILEGMEKYAPPGVYAFRLKEVIAALQAAQCETEEMFIENGE